MKIGWLSSLTGPLSSAAIAENQGVQLAVEEVNKAGGILGKQIELLSRDTAGDPTKAVNFAQQLAFSDKVQFGIGPVNSGEGLAVATQLCQRGLTVLLVEQLVEKALHHAHYGYLVETGRIAAAASPDELREGDLLQRVYLGGAAPVPAIDAYKEKV